MGLTGRGERAGPERHRHRRPPGRGRPGQGRRRGAASGRRTARPRSHLHSRPGWRPRRRHWRWRGCGRLWVVAAAIVPSAVGMKQAAPTALRRAGRRRSASGVVARLSMIAPDDAEERTADQEETARRGGRRGGRGPARRPSRATAWLAPMNPMTRPLGRPPNMSTRSNPTATPAPDVPMRSRVVPARSAPSAEAGCPPVHFRERPPRPARSGGASGPRPGRDRPSRPGGVGRDVSEVTRP